MLHIIKLCIHLAILYGFYYLGMLIQDLFHLFIPGSVIGLILLFICLVCKIIRLDWIETGAAFMMKHLIIFFIPSTVGLMVYLHVLAGKGILLIFITIISTIIVMVTSAFISERLARRVSDDSSSS